MIFLRWKDKMFTVYDERIIGFIVYEAENIVGEEALTLGLMSPDGSLLRASEWEGYGVAVDVRTN